tara:strand:+ start:509 stop:715 length:207 start_codon:yes stop_codon:yes gene_type:complete
MKNSLSSIQKKIDSRKLANNKFYNQNKITDVNILLNRVKIDQKNERNKKIIFSISASLGLLVFGIVIF